MTAVIIILLSAVVILLAIIWMKLEIESIALSNKIDKLPSPELESVHYSNTITKLKSIENQIEILNSKVSEIEKQI